MHRHAVLELAQALHSDLPCYAFRAHSVRHRAVPCAGRLQTAEVLFGATALPHIALHEPLMRLLALGLAAGAWGALGLMVRSHMRRAHRARAGCLQSLTSSRT